MKMKDVITPWNRILGRSNSVNDTNANQKSKNRTLGRSYSVVETKTEYFEECPVNSRKVALGLINGKFRSILTIAFLGLLTFGTGLFIVLVQPYDVLFKLKVIFSDGGEIFEMWRKPPVELYLRVFLFNVTNRDAFLNGTEKLRVQEVGPYVYKELMSHENVTFNENGTISATPSHPLVWVPELSEGHQEDDQLILPNIALLSIAHVVSSQSIFTQFGLNVVIRQTDSHPLIQMSAREFMFGYKSTLLSLGNQFMSNWIYFDKLGLIDRMYDFNGDYETVFTGENDVRKTGLLDTYRGSKQLPEWEGVCGNVNMASDGTKFTSYIKPNDTLLFYRKSMCRAHAMIPVNKTVVSGLQGYVYNFEENANDNGKYRPENSCFCREGRCLPPGLLDVTSCYYGFPIATSYPHFLEADPSIREQVDGTHPDPEKHKSYFIIQPESGLPLEVAARFQINMALGNLGSMAHVEKFSNMILPMLWTESRMYSLPERLSTRFGLYLNVLPVVEASAMYACFLLGPIFIALAAYKYMQKIKGLAKVYKSPWIDEFVEEDVNRKLSAYAYCPAKRDSLSHKELENYFDSLVAPLNQELNIEELQSLRENDV